MREPRIPIPATADEQERIASERDEGWEYVLFAGVLVQEREALSGKWHDHQLHHPRGEFQEFDDLVGATYWVGSEFKQMAKVVGAMNRAVSAPAQEAAFGAPGQEGEPVRIRALAREVVGAYDALMDRAAAIRKASVPQACSEVIETSACIVDELILQLREGIDSFTDTISRLPEIAANATPERPAVVQLNLAIEPDPTAVRHIEEALAKLTDTAQRVSEPSPLRWGGLFNRRRTKRQEKA